MKKLLAMLLAVVMALSLVSVLAVADANNPQIVIDGVKDADYHDRRSIDHSFWYFYADNTNTTEPVDPERITNQLWFTWDDDFLYLYFQATSKDELYKPAEGETELPDRGVTYFEQINLYLDTNPSADYWTKCQQATEENPFCGHFHCNANAGGESGEEESKYYRIMARYSPAFDKWNNYYRSDEGMFMTYDEFWAWRCDPNSRAYDERYVADPMSWYLKENGACEAAGFIDYETNTYGMELKYPIYEGEEYFQFNIVNDAQYIEWEDVGPELPYTQSFCGAWWMNADGLLEIYYDDYPIDVDTPTPVLAIRRKMEQLPVDATVLEESHMGLVKEILADVAALTEEEAEFLTEDENVWFGTAAMKVAMYEYIAALGDINGDKSVNANDALNALKASVNKIQLTEDQLLRAEVTGDGAVNAKDALEMLQVAVKKRTEFSIVRTLEF